MGCRDGRMMIVRKIRKMERKEAGTESHFDLIYRHNIGGSGGMQRWKENVGTKHWQQQGNAEVEKGCDAAYV